jgi:hypothetical protein
MCNTNHKKKYVTSQSNGVAGMWDKNKSHKSVSTYRQSLSHTGENMRKINLFNGYVYGYLCIEVNELN